MSHRQSADVIVIGLGAFGSATTYQLAKRGARVIGIDQYTPPHDRGSSHGASRITRVAVGEGQIYIPLIQRSHAIWRELEAVTGKTLFHQTGGLIIGSISGAVSHHGKPDFVRRTIDNAAQFDIPHEVFDAMEIRKRYPQFITRGDETAYFEPGAGALLPEACVQAQLDQARMLGATLRLNEKVIAIEEDGNGVNVKTASGAYSAAKAIVTAGPWAPAMAGGKVQRHLTVRRQTLHWFKTDKPSLYAPENCPIFIWMHGNGGGDYLYGFPMVDGKHGVKVASEQYHTETEPDCYLREVDTKESLAMYERHVATRLRFVQSETIASAACLYTVSKDSNFIIDAYRDMQNVRMVSACSGHGFKNSAGLGEQLAIDALAGSSGNIDAGGNPLLAPFRMQRFQ